MKIGTLGIVLDEDSGDGRVLLGLRDADLEFGAGIYSGPGGKLDREELPLECLERELQEEFCIQIDRTRVEQVATILFWAGGEPHFKVFVYRVLGFTGEPRKTNEMTPEWFPRDELPFDRMFEADRHWFGKAVRGERFSANIRYGEPGKGFESIEFLPFSD